MGKAKAESKSDRFRRLAKHRTTAALKRMEQIEKLNSGAYEHTPEEALAIVEALRDGVDKVNAALFPGAPAMPTGFEFPEEE